MLNTYPNNPFPPSTEQMHKGDNEELQAQIDSLKSGLTNLDVELSVPDNSGKNLIPMSLAGIKSANTDGTWADNVYTLDGLTFTVLTDSAGNVIGVKANGTAPANDVYFSLGDIDFVKDTSYRMTSGTTGSATDTYRLWAYSSTAFPVGHRLSTDANCGENVARNARANERCFIAFMIMSGYAPENVTVYPMVRLASVSDPTFAPYIPSVDARLDAVESAIKVSRVTVSPDANGYVNLSPSGFTKAGFKYVNAVVTGASSARSYDVRVWLSDNYGWVASIYTVDTFTKVTDTSVSLDLVVFGVAV